MKIRNGFVSNSSSSSFVLLLDGLTEEQKLHVKDLVEKHNEECNSGCGDGWLHIGKRFIFGKKDHHVELDLTGIPEDHYELGD